MRKTDIAKMPRLVGNTRDLLFVLRIAFDKTVSGGCLSEDFADPVIRKVGTDKVELVRLQSQVNRKSRLVLAAVRQRHVFLSEIRAVFFH